MEKLTEQPIKKKIRNFITLNSVTKDEIRKEYNEIFDKLQEYEDKQEWISVEERLPDENEIVLVWDGKLAIARIRKGITEEQREKMRNGELPNNKEFCWSRTDGYHQIERSEIINQCDVWGNNLVPYCWEVYGSLSIMFGQDVYYWMPLPTPPKMKGAE